MRVLALDIGETRVGIAVSDAFATMAMPVKVLPFGEVISMARSFRFVLEDYEPDLLICGLPLSLSGEEGPQVKRIKPQAEAIAAACHLPLEFVDERMSSREAKRILREEGLNERQMRGKIDMVAASVFLQTWLDNRARLMKSDSETYEHMLDE